MYGSDREAPANSPEKEKEPVGVGGKPCQRRIPRRQVWSGVSYVAMR